MVWSQPVTFTFTGSVTSDPFGLSSFGAPIEGRFTFDSAAVDAIASGDSGSFTSNGPGYGFSVNVDGTQYAASRTVTVNTVDGPVVDQYGVIAQDAGLTLELFFEDATHTALASDALPLVPPSIAAFGLREFRLFNADAEFLGTADTLDCVAGCAGVSAVPEPASVQLTAAGLALLVALTRRRASTALQSPLFVRS